MLEKIHAAILRFRQDALLTAKPLGKVWKKRARAGKGYKVWQEPRRARAGLQNLARASSKALQKQQGLEKQRQIAENLALSFSASPEKDCRTGLI